MIIFDMVNAFLNYTGCAERLTKLFTRLSYIGLSKKTPKTRNHKLFNFLKYQFAGQQTIIHNIHTLNIKE